MRCERCGVELTNKIIKINDVAYCENCARLMGYGKFLRSPEEMLGSAFSPFDEIASTIMQMSDLDFGNSFPVFFVPIPVQFAFGADIGAFVSYGIG